jgi:gluconolactonase
MEAMLTKAETVSFDSRFKALVSEAPTLDQFVTGFKFTEGPVWDHRADVFYFTDFFNLKIYKWSRSAGLSIFRDPSGREVGLTLDRQGRLLGCESLQHRISRTEADGSLTGFNNKVGGVRINSPNDLVVKSDGVVYFTDPYSVPMGHPRETPFNGVYRLEPDSGSLAPIIKDMSRPNGLAFSPDEKLLYVNDTDRQLIMVHQMLSDGTVDAGRLFATLDVSYGRGAADGMKVDVQGNVYVTGPGGLWVFAPDGSRLGIVRSPEVVGNFCFGDEDWKSIYLTASTSVYRMRVEVAGVPIGPCKG